MGIRFAGCEGEKAVAGVDREEVLRSLAFAIRRQLVGAAGHGARQRER